jgi:peptide subunit release factor 1 (eRF1)
MTTLDELKQQITVLASVEESDAPFISCYLNLENRQSGWRDVLDERARILRRILKGNDLADLEEALGKIEEWLAADLLPEAKGVAIFARGTCGGSFMLPMQFAAPLPDWIVVYPTPNIYHLVELKDNYHRYVVLLALPNRACIVAVNLGAATIQAWIDQSGLRTRVGSEWARIHYCVNQAHRGDRFVHEKIVVLKQLMHAGGHTHLILAGDPEITTRVRHAMPNELADKLVDVAPASARDRQTEVIILTLSSFIEHEKHECRSVAERLIEGLRSQVLTVVGSAATLDALRRGEVDTLVMASGYQPDPGWTCSACRATGTEPPKTSVCPQCGKPSTRPMDVREALLRLAGQSECTVEVVEQSDALMNLGGVGCLLRYQPDFRNEKAGGFAQVLIKEKAGDTTCLLSTT